MTALTTATRVAHADPTVRRTDTGVTFAHDESMGGVTYCLECHYEAEAVVLVTILNDEEWDYTDGDYRTRCGVCLSDLTCDPDDAEREEREAGLDREAEYLLDIAREREW